MTEINAKIKHGKSCGWSKEYIDYWIAHPFCEVEYCFHFAAPPHHIRSRGAGGTDDAANLISLCREHHYIVHNEGPEALCKISSKYKKKYKREFKK